MIRFIVERKVKCQYSGAEWSQFITVDADVPSLEALLGANGLSETGYEMHHLVGAEVLKDTHPTSADLAPVRKDGE